MPLYKISDVFDDAGKFRDVFELTRPQDEEEDNRPTPTPLQIARLGGRAISRAQQRMYGLAASGAGLPSRSLSAAIQEPSAIFDPSRFAQITENIKRSMEAKRRAEAAYAAKEYPYSKSTQEYLQDPSLGALLTRPTAIAELGAETAGEMVPLVVATAAGHPEIGLAYMAANVGIDSRNEAIDRGATEEQASMEAITNAATTYFTSKYLSVPYMQNPKAKEALGKIASGQLASAAATVGKAMAAGAGEEALQEALEETEQRFSQWVFEQDPEAFDGLVRDVGTNAFFGALFGGAFGGITGGRRAKLESQLRSFTETTEGLERLRAFANNPSRSELESLGLNPRKYSQEERERLAPLVNQAVDAALNERTKFDKIKQPAAEVTSKQDDADVPANDEGYPLKSQITEPTPETEPSTLPEEIPTEPEEIPRTDLQAELRPIIEAKRAKDESSRLQKKAELEKNITRLQNRKKHYKQLEEQARQRGDEVAADAYNRFVKEAQVEITRQLTAVQKAESPTIAKVEDIIQKQRPAPQEVIRQTTEIEQSTPPGELYKPPKKPPAEKPLLPGLATEQAGTWSPAATFAQSRAEMSQEPLGDFFQTRAGKKIARGFKKTKSLFLSRGALPTEKASQAKHGRVGFMAQQLWTTKANIKAFDKSIRQALKSGDLQSNKAAGEKSPSDVIGALNKVSFEDRMKIAAALKGQYDVDKFPKPLRDSIRELRKNINANSVELLNSGAVGGPVTPNLPDGFFDRIEFLDYIRGLIADGDKVVSGERTNRDVAMTELRQAGWTEADAERAITFMEGDGMYINQAHKAHKLKDWYERVPEEVRNDFVSYLREYEGIQIVARLMGNDYGKAAETWNTFKDYLGKQTNVAKEEIPQKAMTLLWQTAVAQSKKKTLAENIKGPIKLTRQPKRPFKKSGELSIAGLKYMAETKISESKLRTAYKNDEQINLLLENAKQAAKELDLTKPIGEEFLPANTKLSSDAELAHQAMAILWRASQSLNPIAVASRANLTSQDLSVLKRKKDLPEIVRSFLGEYSDDTVGNYIRTIYHQARIQGDYDMLQKLRADGLESGYLWEDAESAAAAMEESGGNVAPLAQINKADAPTLFPLHGMWTTPEIYEVLKSAQKAPTDPTWWRIPRQYIERAVIAGKIPFSPMTMLRQIPSNAINGLANGNLPIEAIKSIQTVWDYARGNKEKFQAYIEEAIRLGILGEDINVGAFHELTAGHNTWEEAVHELELNMITTAIKKGVKAVEALYTSIDAIHKLGEWESEKKKYRKTFPEWSEEQLKTETAEIVRNLSMTYSKISPFFRDLNRSPISKIISYKTEMFRNHYHRAKQIKKELSNPRTRAIGAKRTAGYASAMLLNAGLNGGKLGLATWALSQAFGFTDQDDDDLREVVNEYDRNGDLGKVGRTEDGSIHYFNGSYSHPFATIGDSVRSLILGKTWEEKALTVGKELLENYYSPKFTVEVLSQWYSNINDYGNPIYLETDSPPERLEKLLKQAEKKLGPNLWLTGRQTIERLQKEEEGLPPEKYSIKALKSKTNDIWAKWIGHATGLRIVTVNPRVQLSYITRDYSRDMQDIKSDFRYQVSKTRDPETILKRTEILYDKMQQTFDQQKHVANATLRLLEKYDFDDIDAVEIMKKQGVGEEEAKAIIRGTMPDWAPDDLELLTKVQTVLPDQHPYKRVVAEKRDEILSSKIWTATGPSNSTEKSAAQELLKRFNITPDEQDRILAKRFNEEDIRREMKDILENKETTDEDVARAVAEQRVGTGYSPTKARGKRFNLIDKFRLQEQGETE